MDVHFLEQNRRFRYILIFIKLRKRDGSSLFGKCGKLSVPLLIKLQLYRICWGKGLVPSLNQREGWGASLMSSIISCSCLIQGKDQV